LPGMSSSAALLASPKAAVVSEIYAGPSLESPLLNAVSFGRPESSPV
jgi:hypothetical protein